MERQKVSSSNIKAVGYLKSARVLEVEFNNGTIYYYTGVPAIEAENLFEAPSIGKFFNSRIKNSFKFNKGEYKKVEYPNIYICGKAGAGKSVLADYLVAKLGYKRSKFASPVYNIGYEHFDMEGKDRTLLQTIGTDVGRGEIDDAIWVRRFAEDMTIAKRTREILGIEPVRYVSDDTRFPNEHLTLKDNGWVGLFLDAPEALRLERLIARDGSAQEEALSHKSETVVDSFKDDLITVDSSVPLAQLQEAFDALLKTIME